MTCSDAFDMPDDTPESLREQIGDHWMCEWQYDTDEGIYCADHDILLFARYEGES